MREDEEEEGERRRVMEYVKKEVEDWDDEEKVRSRFKGFSGQIGDYEWQSRYVFWEQLILKVAAHLGIFIIRPNQLKLVWFRRGTLSPLCLDHVLVEMLKNGELLPISHLVPPSDKIAHLSRIFWKVVRFVSPSPSSTFNPQALTDDYLVISSLLKEKGLEVVKLLSDSHWTPSCAVTMNKFQEICGGLKEASAVLSHLSDSGKAKYLSIQRKDLIEGVKVALSPGAVCGVTNLDYDVLQLVWTVERLEQQLDLIDSRCKKFKSLALAFLKSGDRSIALRHARKMKLASQGRERCATLLNQVEEVLRAIADAESSKKVSEAIIIGARAMKENRITEEVELALQELHESTASQKQVDRLLESTSSSFGIEDEDIEDELQQLELDISKETIQASVRQVDTDSSTEVNAVEITNTLSSALSDLKLTDHAAAMESASHENLASASCSISKNVELKQAESLL